MTTLFHDLIHKEIEVYVDDMIAKSQAKEGHVEDLLKLFQRLRKYRLRLNQINVPSVLDHGNCWVLLLSREGLKLALIKSKQFKKCPAEN